MKPTSSKLHDQQQDQQQRSAPRLNRYEQMMRFMHIVDCGSISRAAEKLNLSKSVLSQDLKALERYVGTLLLKRTTRRQALTDAGQGFYQHCRQMQQLAEHAFTQLANAQKKPTGKLTVTAPYALMETIVLPTLINTFAAFPEVRLHLITQDRQLDLQAHDIDLAIRVGESADSLYRQKKIGQLTDCLCQSATASGSPWDSLYIANAWQSEQLVHEIAGQRYTFRAHHRSNSIMQTKMLIEAGMGIGVLPSLLATASPAIKVIHAFEPINIYTLHPYAGMLPLTVAWAQQAILQAFVALENAAPA